VGKNKKWKHDARPVGIEKRGGKSQKLTEGKKKKWWASETGAGGGLTSQHCKEINETKDWDKGVLKDNEEKGERSRQKKKRRNGKSGPA